MKKTINELLNFGIILIDKPSGPTSFDVSNYVKNELGLKKTSHFGTLDPKVGGVLPIALGRACRLTGFFFRPQQRICWNNKNTQRYLVERITRCNKQQFHWKNKTTPTC